MTPKQPRALLILGLLALLAISVGFAGIAGAFALPIAKPNGVDARDWVLLFVALSWVLVFDGALALVGISCVVLVRALDRVKPPFPKK